MSGASQNMRHWTALFPACSPNHDGHDIATSMQGEITRKSKVTVVVVAVVDTNVIIKRHHRSILITDEGV